MKTLSLIVPCFNEEAMILESYRRMKAVVDALPEHWKVEIIYVNDGSTDDSRRMLNEIAVADKQVKVLHFSRNFGHQPAVSAGIHHCRSDFAIILDADLQDPPETIPDILELQEREQANSVYCVRRLRRGESSFKLVSAKLFYRTMNTMSEVHFPLDTGDFRLIDRKIMNEFNRLNERGKYIRGLISWVGFKQVPFFYERQPRLAGETKYPLAKMIAFASKALLYFSKKPLKMAMSLGFLAVFLGFFLLIWFTLGKIYGFSHAESGWTSLITIIIFFGGVQLITVGVLGQYMGTLFDEIKARPEYIVDEIVNNEEKDV
ncbi:MAG: glycosyltransferase family 2 protein [Tannerellaceae bacterium]|jgi:dolichol-phosphate mannosyltransferase|nr:glycosyltransferase family 2 protein [Tannerellaceae bacterium]